MDAAEACDWDLVGVRSIQFVAMLASLHQNCFTGDTLVSTEDGQKRIDEIKVGDKVWAYNTQTGETELKAVTKVYIHETDELLHLYTTAGTIDTTTNHPFYVVDKGWVAAGDLAVGDEIYALDGTTSVVTGSQLEKLDKPIKVYNLEVEDFHTYFVGDVPVLVHNYEQGDVTPDGYTFSGHAADRANERGFSAEEIDDIINNNDPNYQDYNDTWLHKDIFGNGVVVNAWNLIVTVFRP
ncbi:MAG: polymorphic toxin-type HINT domain-containing protein [Oscillospiraceae bacterium]